MQRSAAEEQQRAPRRWAGSGAGDSAAGRERAPIPAEPTRRKGNQGVLGAERYQLNRRRVGRSGDESERTMIGRMWCVCVLCV